MEAIERVSVSRFIDAPGADAGYSGVVVADAVTLECVGVSGWTVVERDRMEEIWRELDLQTIEDFDRATAVRLGKLVGADGILVGEVMQYRIGSIPFVFFFALDHDVYKVEFAFRLMSVETGEVCMAARVGAESLKSFDDAIGSALSDVFVRIAEECRAGRGLLQ